MYFDGCYFDTTYFLAAPCVSSTGGRGGRVRVIPVQPPDPLLADDEEFVSWFT